MALTDKLTAIGDAIREKTETTELIPLAEMPNKVNEVFEIGSSAGYAEGHLTGYAEGQQDGWNNGYENGKADGRKAEYDKFWDSCQQNGNRKYYYRAFVGSGGWDKYNFYPKYDIRPTGDATQIFYAWENAANQVGFDLAQRLEECGVVLDTSQATNLYAAFSYSHFSRLPAVDVSNITTTSSTSTSLFGNSYGALKTIDKIIMSENTTPVSSWFINSYGLVNITIEGTIGQNGFDVSPCSLLTHDSLMSIINALKNFTDGTTKTVTLGATNIAKLTDAEKAIATQKGWTLA